MPSEGGRDGTSLLTLVRREEGEGDEPGAEADQKRDRHEEHDDTQAGWALSHDTTSGNARLPMSCQRAPSVTL